MKVIPSNYLFERWDKIWSVCCSHLGHSASTVRQACSSFLIDVVVTSNMENGARFAMTILQGLTKSWEYFKDSDVASDNYTEVSNDITVQAYFRKLSYVPPNTE